MLLTMSAVTSDAQNTFSQNDINEFSYALGVSQTQGLKEYLVDRLEVDTMYMDAFLKGVQEAVTTSFDKKKMLTIQVFK